MARDMTRGNITQTLAVFSGPLILSGLLQQLYSWADALIVGNFIDENALAAIGATGPVSMLFIAILSGFSVGVSILASQAYGQGDMLTVEKTASSFATILGAASIVLTIIGIFLSKPLLSLLGTPMEIYEDSASYLLIVYFGVPFMAVYNIYNAVLRGIGDSRMPLIAISISAAANIVLDLLFVAVFHLGIPGAAAATVISQAAMSIFLIIYSRRKYSVMRFPFSRDMVDRGVVKRGLQLSLPTAVQAALRSVGALMLQDVMNSFGKQTVAGVTTAYRIDSIALLPIINLSAGISTFTAQNIGGGNISRARKGLKTGVALSVGTSVVIVAAIVPAAGRLMSLFGVSQAVADIGRELIFALAMFYPVFGLLNALTGYLQGLGDVTFTGIVNVAALGLRIALSYILAPYFGRQVIAYSELISWVCLAAVCLVRVAAIRRRTYLRTPVTP